MSVLLLCGTGAVQKSTYQRCFLRKSSLPHEDSAVTTGAFVPVHPNHDTTSPVVPLCCSAIQAFIS